MSSCCELLQLGLHCSSLLHLRMPADLQLNVAEPPRKKKSKKRAADAEVAASPADMPMKKKKKKAKAST